MKEFEMFTELDRMKNVLRQQFPEFSEDNLIIKKCKIEHARFQTSHLSICYRLRIIDKIRQREGERMLYAKVYPRYQDQMELQNSKISLVPPQRAGEKLVHLPKFDMVVRSFPDDPALLYLPEVIDPKRVKHYLPYNTPPFNASGPEEITDISVEVIQYLPETRCTTRYSLQWGIPDKPRQLTLFGKTFKNDQGGDIYRRMEALWKRSNKEPNSFMVAQPLEYNKKVKTLWQVGLPGVPLVKVISHTNYKVLIEAVAKGLENLHKRNLSTHAKLTTYDRFTKIKKKTLELVQAFPSFADSLLSILGNLEKTESQLTPVTERLIHGDFHINQLLIHKGNISLLDFDDFAVGDPMQDIACFIVDLYFQDLDADLVNLMISTIYYLYRSQVDWEVPFDRLNWHTRVQLLTKAYRSYIRLRPNLKDRIRHIVTLAQEGLILDNSVDI